MKQRWTWTVLAVALGTTAGIWLKNNLRRAAPPAELKIETAWESLPESTTIRVNLTGSPRREIDLSVDGPYKIQPVGSPTILGKGDRLPNTTARASDAGIQIGDSEYTVSRLEIVPEKSPAIWINRHQYRGTVRLFRRPNGRLIAVNVLPVEHYLASVVDSEMPASFPPAARRAQAVVARTYAYYQMLAARDHPRFDLYGSSRSQEYLGFQYYTSSNRRWAGESRNSRQIVADTHNMVATYQGRLFCTYYSAVCGGRTTFGPLIFSDAAPPLRSVPCQWCSAATRYRWTKSISLERLSANLQQYLQRQRKSFGSLASISSKMGQGDSASVVNVGDGRRDYQINSTEFRQAVAAILPSASFAVRIVGDTVQFDGRGHGHGVGMCQWGARGLGEADRSFRDILRFYYPGAEIVVLKPRSE